MIIYEGYSKNSRNEVQMAVCHMLNGTFNVCLLGECHFIPRTLRIGLVLYCQLTLLLLLNSFSHFFRCIIIFPTYSQFESLERIPVNLIQNGHKRDGKLDEHNYIVILLLQ